MIIYKITNKINGKIYIGQTAESLENRVKRHFGYQCKEHDTKFYRAIRKYGKENFTWEIIDESNNQDELNKKEVYWIKYYDSMKNGYNSKDDEGKCGGDTLSNNPRIKEIKKKIADSKLGSKNPHSVKVRSINIKTGKVIEYSSMIECQEALGIQRHDVVSRRCRNIIKKPYKNTYLFEYIS